MRKKATRTFTEEEAEEHRLFMRNLHQKIQVSKEDHRRIPSQRQQLQQYNRKRSHQRNFRAEKENNNIEKRARSQETERVVRKEGTEKKESIPKDPTQPRPTALQEQRQNNTKPQLTQQLETTNERAESNVEKSSKAKEDDYLSLYAEGFSDTEIQEAFNEIISTPQSSNKTSASHLLENRPPFPQPQCLHPKFHQYLHQPVHLQFILPHPKNQAPQFQVMYRHQRWTTSSRR